MKRDLRTIEEALAEKLGSVIRNDRSAEGLFSGLLQDVSDAYYCGGYGELRLSTVLMLEYVYQELIREARIAQVFKDMIRAIVVYHVARLGEGRDQQDNTQAFIEQDTQAGFDID